MLQKFYSNREKFFALLAVSMFMVLSMLSSGTSFALDPYHVKDAKPLSSVADKWVKIEPGEIQWFMLDYEAKPDYDGGEVSFAPLSVWMDVEYNDYNMNFSIWSPDRLERLRDEKGDTDKAPALGQGSMNDLTPGDYYWAGEYFENATIYVAVENNSHETRYYSIDSANKHH